MKRLKVLIVEDEAIIAEDLKITLADLGCSGKAVLSPDRAIAEVTENAKPDLIVMDVRLNEDEDGIQTARTIQKIAKIPILFITAFPPKQILGPIKGIFRAGYLHKPVSRSQFRASIQSLLAITLA
jgi:CheY-like chemotaxis protein